MKRTFYLVGIYMASTSFILNAQTLEPSRRATCSAVINSMSYYWKLDSLPSNGYRQVTKNNLLECSVDSVSADFILNKLGTPSWETGNEYCIEYAYVYYDWKYIHDSNVNRRQEKEWIYFAIDRKSRMLKVVGHTTRD